MTLVNHQEQLTVEEARDETNAAYVHTRARRRQRNLSFTRLSRPRANLSTQKCEMNAALLPRGQWATSHGTIRRSWETRGTSPLDPRPLSAPSCFYRRASSLLVTHIIFLSSVNVWRGDAITAVNSGTRSLWISDQQASGGRERERKWGGRERDDANGGFTADTRRVHTYLSLPELVNNWGNRLSRSHSRGFNRRAQTNRSAPGERRDLERNEPSVNCVAGELEKPPLTSISLVLLLNKLITIIIIIIVTGRLRYNCIKSLRHRGNKLYILSNIFELYLAPSLLAGSFSLTSVEITARRLVS